MATQVSALFSVIGQAVAVGHVIQATCSQLVDVSNKVQKGVRDFLVAEQALL